MSVMAVFLTALCACFPQNTQEAQPEETVSMASSNSMSVGVYNFDTYNPIATASQSVTQVSAFIYDSLVRRRSDWSVEPCLCESYTISDGGSVFTFEIKSGVRWHDGSEFGASDVDYTFRMIEELEQSPYKDRFEQILSYRRVGQSRFIVTLKESDAGFINLMDIPIIKNGTDCKEGLKEYVPIGTGAYKYVKSDMSRAIKLVRNEDYTVGAKPLIDEILIKQVPDKESLVSALEIGEIDTAQFTGGEMRAYNPKGNFGEVSYTNGALTFIGLNTENAHLALPQVRRAISYAADREEICKNVFFGRARSVCVPVPPDSYLYKGIYTLDMDADRAEMLLSEAGYIKDESGVAVNAESGEKLSLGLIVNSENELRTAAAEAVKSYLGQIGIEVNVRQLSFTDYEARIKAGSYDMFIGETEIGRDFDLSLFAASDAVFGTYSDESFDTLLRRCKTAQSMDEFALCYSELAEKFLSQMPIVPLAMGNDVLLVNNKIKGVTSAADGSIFANTASWYIE